MEVYIQPLSHSIADSTPLIQTHVTSVVLGPLVGSRPHEVCRPIVLNTDTQKAGTVGGQHNTFLSSLAEATFIQLMSSQEATSSTWETR